MFRCLDCGEKFREPIKLTETHGLSTPPYEKTYVCPTCKGHGYKPLIRDSISRREVLDKLVDIMKSLNMFERAVCEVFGETCFDGNSFDFARSDMYELIVSVAGDSEFDLPRDIDSKIFDMRTNSEAAAVMALLTKNIEGE